RLYAPEVVGRVARARLERLASRPAGAAPRPEARGVIGAMSDLRLTAVEDELAFDPERGAPPEPRGLRGALRRAVLRLMLPFTLHERKFDRAVVAALRGLQLELERERALRLEDRQRIERLEERLRASGGGESGPTREA